MVSNMTRRPQGHTQSGLPPFWGKFRIFSENCPWRIWWPPQISWLRPLQRNGEGLRSIPAFVARLPRWQIPKNSSRGGWGRVSRAAKDSLLDGWWRGRGTFPPKIRCKRLLRAPELRLVRTTIDGERRVLGLPAIRFPAAFRGTTPPSRASDDPRRPSSEEWELNHRPTQPSTSACCPPGSGRRSPRRDPKAPRCGHSGD